MNELNNERVEEFLASRRVNKAGAQKKYLQSEKWKAAEMRYTMKCRKVEVTNGWTFAELVVLKLPTDHIVILR